MKVVSVFKWFQPYDVQISIENNSDKYALEGLKKLLTDKKIQRRFSADTVEVLQKLTEILLQEKEAKPQ